METLSTAKPKRENIFDNETYDPSNPQGSTRAFNSPRKTDKAVTARGGKSGSLSTLEPLN